MLKTEIIQSFIQRWNEEVHHFYIVNYKEFPNVLAIGDIDNKEKAIFKLKKTYPFEEALSWEKKVFNDKELEPKLSLAYYHIGDNVAVIYRGDDKPRISLLYKEENETFNDLKSFFQSYMGYKEKQLYFITEDYLEGYQLDNSPLNYDASINITDYYNDDFQEFNRVVKCRLQKNSSGLVLLHGLPGTGKTSYIRYLCSEIDKKFIYLSAQQTDMLNEPKFFTFLKKHPDSVLILEDAEEILTPRTSQRDNFVSNLLNLTDGLLGDCLRIQVICTFNSKLQDVDQALLRNGRLQGRYEFKALEHEKAKALNPKIEAKGKLVLSDVLQEDVITNVRKQSNRIGFLPN